MLTQDQIDEWEVDMSVLPILTNQELVEDFHYVMGQPLDVVWKFQDDLEQLRSRLVNEEMVEFMLEEEPAAILKELADILYVCYGYAATYGWDLDTAFQRVHQSNMSKLGNDGRPMFREDGKVVKGPNYKKPDLGDLV